MAATELSKVAPPAEPPATARVATVMGAATLGAHAAQMVWLALGARVMGLDDFGAVLAGQALYYVLQSVVDIGPSQLGARRSAKGLLDDPARGALTRTRLIIAVPATAVIGAYAAIGGDQTAVAVLPFAVALPLFALLNVWERYGRGDGVPMASYLFLRAAVPAVAVATCLVLSLDFPPWLAGGAECAAIVVVMAANRLAPIRLARAAMRVAAEPIVTVARIGLISVMFQLSVASGTLLLALTGEPAAAAALGVGLRLVTGLNSLLGVLSAALFPRLAARSHDRAAASADAAAAGLILRTVVTGAATAVASAMLLADPLAHAFLNGSDDAARVSLMLAVAAVPAAAASVALSTVLVARDLERPLIAPIATGAVTTVALGLIVVFADPGDPALMAGGVLAGQLVMVVCVASRSGEKFIELRGAARSAALASVAVGVCAGAVALTDADESRFIGAAAVLLVGLTCAGLPLRAWLFRFRRA